MSRADLFAHLATGATHVCQCWSIERTDGATLGFTDHDQQIEFDGVSFRPQSGLSARALTSTTGLSVDNTEALGVLSSAAISEQDLVAGRYDGAKVTIWRLQWDQPEARIVLFVGTMGEVTRTAGQFEVELRGLAEALNQPQGRSYLRACGAVLGDDRCRFDLSDPLFAVETEVKAAAGAQSFQFEHVATFNDHWFKGGVLTVLSGDAEGLSEIILSDRISDGGRTVVLGQPLALSLEAGDLVRLVAGCDKRAETCRTKFDNFTNFRGFPDIPGDDWLVSVPKSTSSNTGGSRSR